MADEKKTDSEYRIGNYLYKTNSFKDAEHDIFVVSELPIDRLKDGVSYKPIPLSAAWMKRLGFKEKEVPGCDPVYYWQYEDEFELGWDKTGGIDLFYDGSTHSLSLPHIKYVHQLQNLIHSMAGNELIIS